MNNSNSAVPTAIPDVQGEDDLRRVAIDRVGVKDVTYPFTLRTKSGDTQTATAKINMYVSLPHQKKGTHMSRFLEVLNEQTDGAVDPSDLPAIAREIKSRLQADHAYFEAEFTYFVKKHAPVTKQPGLMDYRVRFECVANSTDDLIMSVAAPATSLCPCSKEISEYGAHNQRCLISASVRIAEGEHYWIEELVGTLEAAASAPVYATLKRPDEKFVTEQAYDNPKFVEDIVRDLALGLEAEDRVVWYSIDSENFESIHSHNAYASITQDKRP